MPNTFLFIKRLLNSAKRKNKTESSDYKLKESKLNASSAEFNFEELLQRAAYVVNSRMEEKHHNFKIFIDNSIPNILIGDDIKLIQVLINLLGNAVKFTNDNGMITLNAHLLRETNDTATVQITVKDTGIGINKKQQEKLFKLFQQTDYEIMRRYSGTGLGLPICKNLLDLMEGKLFIKSEPGIGSIFGFTINLNLGGNNKLNPFHDLSNKNLRVLIVDEDIELLNYLKNRLIEINIQCETAFTSGDTLSQIAQNDPFDIIFINLNMPQIDGLTLAKKLKSLLMINNCAIVLIASAADWKGIENEAEKIGIYNFISKPIFPSVIAGSIKDVIDSKVKKFISRL